MKSKRKALNKKQRVKLKKLTRAIDGQRRAHKIASAVDQAFPPEQRQMARLVGGMFADLVGDHATAARLFGDHVFETVKSKPKVES